MAVVQWAPIAPGVFDNLSTTTAIAPESGFVVVYVDNQTIGKDVWFDNVQVLHYNTQVLEENHYYPFGLTTSVSAMGMTPQPYKYQGIELEKNFGLEMYETFYRGLDPQLGRFNSVDPEAEQFYSISPYVSMNNNPVSYIDPEGDLVFLAPFIIPAIQATLVTLSAYYFYETVKQSYSGSNNYGSPWSSMGTSTTYGTYDPTHFGGFSQTSESNSPILLNSSERKEAEVGSEENPHETSRAARRGAMREGGVPTSQSVLM